jgi:hypothetical protein
MEIFFLRDPSVFSVILPKTKAFRIIIGRLFV